MIQHGDLLMHSNSQSKSRIESSGRSKSFSTGDYESNSTSVFDYILRALYKIAYKGHLVVNYFLRSKTQGAYVAIWHEGRILLIRNSYKSAYTLPCGGIDRGEAPVEAASRELFEEVGLDFSIEAFNQVFETINQTEFKKDHIFLFEVNLKALPSPQPDGREVIWAGFRTLEDALEMPLFPPVRNYLLKKATTDRK
jgi:8-oxo-dGTP diphosphatase